VERTSKQKLQNVSEQLQNVREGNQVSGVERSSTIISSRDERDAALNGTLRITVRE
jgi:hypothetical protein